MVARFSPTPFASCFRPPLIGGENSAIEGKWRLGVGLGTRSHSSRRSATPERGAAAVKAQRTNRSPTNLSRC